MSFEVLACRRHFHPGKLKQQFLRFYCIGFLVYCTWTYLIWRPRCMLQNSPSHFWQVSSCYYIHTSSCIICAIRGKLLRERERERLWQRFWEFKKTARLLVFEVKKKKGFIKRQLILKITLILVVIHKCLYILTYMYISTGAVVVHNILGTPKDPIEKASMGDII